MTADLIYDVGMNNGDDTAYYLHKGFRVVAVEADPVLVEAARERFAEPIRQGRLQLVNCAVGPREEVADFWICEDHSEWNSFDRRIASREGRPHHAIPVQCRRFRSLLEEYGLPYYLKVDIEGHDHYCIADLDPGTLPPYLSIEMSDFESLFALQALGYTGFKLITQNDHTQLAIDPLSVRQMVKRRLRPYPALFRLGRLVSSLRERVRPPARGDGSANGHRASALDAGWTFTLGSSGPFAEDTDGPWQTLETVAHTWVAFQLGQSRYGPPSLDVWHDVHATVRDVV
jgi:FkbM family methyltransferase